MHHGADEIDRGDCGLAAPVLLLLVHFSREKSFGRQTEAMPPRRYGSAKPLIASVPKPPAAPSSITNGDAAEETESIATASHQDNPMEFELCSNRSALDDELDFSSSTKFRTKALSSASAKIRKDSPVEVVDVDAPHGKRPALPEKKSNNQASKKPVKLSQQETKQTKVSAAFIGEFGQVRSKLDDIEFILDGLHPSQSSEVRTNSVMSLAKLCKDTETRGLFRSHSLLDKVRSVFVAWMLSSCAATNLVACAQKAPPLSDALQFPGDGCSARRDRVREQPRVGGGCCALLSLHRRSKP